MKQETESLKCAVEILLELYHEKSTVGEDHEKTEGKLLSVLADVLSYFLGITSKSQQESWTGLLCLVFEQLLDLPDVKFQNPEYFKEHRANFEGKGSSVRKLMMIRVMIFAREGRPPTEIGARENSPRRGK